MLNNKNRKVKKDRSLHESLDHARPYGELKSGKTDYNHDEDERLELDPREDYDEDDHSANDQGWGYQRSYRSPGRKTDREPETAERPASSRVNRVGQTRKAS